MSYRAIKHLLGETSLERKFRYLFGALILVLITLSFWYYAYRTEHVAYDQLVGTSQLLVDPVVAQQIAISCHVEDETDEEALRRRAMDDIPQRWKQFRGTKAPIEYGRRFILPDTKDPERKAEEPVDYQQLREFQEDKSKLESNQLLLSQEKDKNYYYAAVRAQESCLGCHRKQKPDMQLGDLIAMVRIS